ncbi:DsbA family oxidoreductase [Alisedimentitalea sp. MJ-SS2]|uniref:DsbA family oxidoreductase n=1 Tax=Aliisedimentitalea sp. MJ-SS2 TaxID=3049795 RepID=UPI00290CFB77|nr:DsbA family oxidoreductase [Alisedimentitalea sp. MJ-SS2]MDU8927460.1 DsbA family oxidoreductase [Alisedimentitalea sp. MJ-SS2]
MNTPVTDIPAPLRIDIVSDVVCPWCIIGYSQLARAIDQTDASVQILWHPFELNPQMPPQGQNLREHLAEKYGTTVEDSIKARAQLTELGASHGFTFNFSDDSRMVNTFHAHQLIELAETQGRQTDMKLALFKAHFSDGRDVSDIATLAAIAGELGLDASDAQSALTENRFAGEVRTMQKFWIDKGVRGVPAMVFDLKHLVTGAQGVDTYAQLLKRFSPAPA